jgi:hypothetical protein
MKVYSPTGKETFDDETTEDALLRDRQLMAVWGLGEMTAAVLAVRAACVDSTMLDDCDAVTMSTRFIWSALSL